MNQREKWEFICEVHQIGDDLNFDNFLSIEIIKRQRQRLHVLCEQYCNGTIQDELFEQKNKKIVKRVLNAIEKLNNNSSGKWRAEFQHDPRGNVLKLLYKHKEGDYEYNIWSI